MAAFDDYLARFGPSPYDAMLAPPPAPAAPPRGMVAPQVSGPNGVMGYVAAPAAGAYEALGMLGSAAQAGAKLVGADTLAQQAADFAARQRAAAATYESPELSQLPWYDPRGLAYQVLKGAPAAVAGLAGAGVGALAAPESAVAGLIGAGAAGLPLAIGGNVQRLEDKTGQPLTTGQAARAAAFGVPEAVVGALPFKGLGNIIARGAEGTLLNTVTHQVGAQAAASAGQDLIAQQMSDPDRPIFNRMSEMLGAAVTGGVTGGLMGAGVHALSKAAPGRVTNEDLDAAVEQALEPPKLLPPPAVRAGPPPQDMSHEQLLAAARAAHAAGDNAALAPLLAEMRQRAGPPTPEPEREAVIPQPDLEQVGLVNETPVREAGLTPDELERLNVTGPRPEPEPSEDMERAIPEPGAPQEAVIPQPSIEDVNFAVRALEDRPVPEGGTDLGEAPNFAYADHEPAILPETGPEPHPLAEASPDQLRRAVRAQARTVPSWLDTSSFENAQKSIREEIGQRDEDSPPLRAAVQRIGQLFGVLDDKGDVIPEPQSERNSPARDAIPERHQAKWDTLEALRDKVGDKPNLTKEIDDAQTMLVDPSRGDLSKVAATVKRVNKAVEGAQAEGELAARRGEEPPKPATTPPAAPVDEPAPPPAAESMVKTLLAKKPAIVEAPQTAPAAPETRAAIQNVQASLDKLEALPPPRPGNTKADAALNKAWAEGLAAQRAKLQSVNDAVEKGDVRSLQRPDAYGFANDKLYFKPGMPKEYQAALDAHAELEAQLAAAREEEFPPGAAFARPAGTIDNGPRDANDVGVTGIVNAGGSGKDVLQFLRTHGTVEQRVTATKLLKNGVDPSIEFAAQTQRGVNQAPGESAAATYLTGSNHIQLHTSADLAQTVLHEAVHSGSDKALAAGGAEAKAFHELFDEVRGRLYPDEGENPNALRDAHEFMAEAYTNPQFRAWLRGQRAIEDGQPTTLWQKFKNAVARLLGFEGGQRTLLDQVIERGDRVLKANRAAAIDTPRDVEALARPYFQKLDEAKEQIHSFGDDLKVGTQKTILPARNTTDIVASLVKSGVASAQRFLNAKETAEARANVWSKSDLPVLRALADLPKAEKEKYFKVADATRIGIDARKATGDLPLSVRNDPELMKEYAKARQAFTNMSPEARAAYEAAVDMNQGHRAFMLAQSLHNYVNSLKLGAKGFENDLAAERQFDDAAHESPQIARDKAMAELAKRVAGLEDYLTTAKSKDLSDASRNGLGQMLDIVRAEQKALAADTPYFRSGRSGDFFVSGALPAGKDGRPDPVALDKLRRLLDEGRFTDLALNRLLDNPRLYARVETREQAQRLEDIFRAAQAKGVLDKEAEIGSGLADDATLKGMRPALLDNVIDAMRENAPDTTGLSKDEARRVEDAHQINVTELARQLMDVLPNSAQMKISAPRKDVQLYENDIGVGLKQGAEAYGRLLANMGTIGEKQAALAGMRDEMKGLKHSAAPVMQKEMTQNALGELLQRDIDRPRGAPNSLVGKLKGLSYLFELATPSYGLTLLSQNATLGLPELGSRVGYASAAKALAKAVIPSFQAMRGMMTSPDWMSAGMRYDALKRGGLSDHDAKLLVQLDNMGKMTSAAFTHMLMGKAEEGPGWREKLAKVSTAYTRYAELQPRIQVALAADRAYRPGKDGDRLQFIAKVIDSSQFNYDATTMPRIMSRAGPLGELAPLMTQFWRFRTELTHKLYREFENGFFAGDGKNWGDADRQRSRSFLYGHLAAMTVLAGSLGLPMVGVLASVADKLADWATGDPTHDLTAAYRMHLMHLFGAGVGEAVAHGAPRALGMDFSHLGEGKIAPGVSEALMALTEKRKFEDAEKDWLKRLAGAPIGTLSNMVVGMRDIANGDYMRGLTRLAPEGLKGPLEAAQMAKYGYRDRKGMPLRINGQVLTPTAKDMVMQAFGVDPAKEAEYEEVSRVASGLKTRQQIQSQNISQHLIQAVMRRDNANLAYWEGQSNLFAQQHPGVLPPAASLGEELATQMRQNVMGGYGIPVRNLRARGMVGFANPHQ